MGNAWETCASVLSGAMPGNHLPAGWMPKVAADGDWD
jgi:hypothetical protein